MCLKASTWRLPASMPAMPEVDEPYSTIPATCSANGMVTVSIGTEELARSPSFVRELVSMVNRAYGHHRLGEYEARHRLRAGKQRPGRNRVLHVAMRDGKLVGCCSSTLFTPWCAPGCGHWGLLVVDPAAQGSGVASALVQAAERRLSAEGLTTAGIEYSYRAGEPLSERLLAWYEDRLQYVGPRHRESGFRMCRKRLLAAREAKPGGRSRRTEPGPSMCLSALSSLVLFFRWLVAILLWMCCGQY